MSIDPETKREIIIVRRGKNDDHDGHHGGVWKIAYADFMTAMMAFFLVMWLINAANEESKAAVASYFNPVKLMDRHSSPKGVQDIDEQNGKVRFESDTQIENGTKVINDNAASPPIEQEESRMFREPYAVLSELAHETGVLQNQSAKGDGGSAQAGTQTGSDGGDAYRDPFSPDYWSNRAAEELTPPEAAPATPPQQTAEAKAKSKAEGAEKPVGAQEKLISDLKKAAEGNTTTDDGKAAQAEPMPDVTVVPVDGGVMIQLTDKVDFGMFTIGSAKPDARVVQMLERIAQVIARQSGDVIISGHTDARPFKSANYDNWRLSSARAQMAYYMLVRGGLDEKRVLRVEGYADRQPKNASDPNAAENRRIDIFLKSNP
ncbi:MULTISPECIES: flagellar motor protein MotB [Brucella/Ochrobactrum group]|uniref:flagellar motor protein MotB n=1 Tax=Brucella/Ochrobactrum group TaxID=2826938 RepID=UPI001C042721|nr:flagellar motor protein MotB [Brucella sp. NBRC 12950]QWK79799.1 OmpA family protein [Ochrobactrum sp. BTU1]GLU25890.1 flagellar motor protein MotB [Brucella sp. NBRC 12950]